MVMVQTARKALRENRENIRKTATREIPSDLMKKIREKANITHFHYDEKKDCLIAPADVSDSVRDWIDNG